MNPDQLKPHITIRGNILPEPVQIIVATPIGESVKIIGKGIKSGKVYEPILNSDQIQNLQSAGETETYDGNPLHFRLGVEAMRLGLAYEYDPYFSLSIARVDPLPHQLEAVYDYFLKLPRIRFLLADDPGAGKTIMAGLLIKELKIRGLIQRILIVTPANLSFQWQRELQEKFHEKFEIIRGDVLRANYGSNPWQEKHQVVTSISWASRIDDARESLLRSHWDLIIVDEAHKMSAYSADRKTQAYQLGEALSDITDHYLLMTATPHKGDPANFCLFLELLDRDVYGDIQSLEEAMKMNEAPFYLRRVKEALVTFPDPETGKAKALFTKRKVQTSEFQIDHEEYDFYEDLTHYVEDQSIKAFMDDSAKGRALGFTMAMLQRRFASSVYAVRRSLERMRDKREKILANPTAYRDEQIWKKLPDDFDDLSEDERTAIMSDLEEVVASIDPSALREEIRQLNELILKARTLEERDVQQSKLIKLKEVLTDHHVFSDPNMKLLLFTEHKDTLDYLVSKLREWNLSVTQIHGGMKIGDRNTPGTRIYSEKEFRDDCQVLVATEAAGEGINLQFCWFMINYDIPWNPVRLEQRMGRIHRYGQDKDCLIFNFVSTNTREGRVLQKLFERIKKIEHDLDPEETGKVFNVIGDVFPANMLERMLRELYARNLTEDVITSRIIETVDTERLQRITHSTLEGLAKRELNLSAIVGKSAEAKERRLVPEVIEDFFISASPMIGIHPKATSDNRHAWRIGKIPRNLWPIGEQLEHRFGKLGREYKTIAFDKRLLHKNTTLDWVTPGHPLFECVRESVVEKVQDDLARGAVFYDLHTETPYRLDLFSAAIRDGLGHYIHRKLFVVQTNLDGEMSIRQPTIFLDIAVSDNHHELPDDARLPGKDRLEHFLIEAVLNKWLEENRLIRDRQVEVVRKHIDISLNALIDRQNCRMADLIESQMTDEHNPLLAANLKKTEDRLFELNARKDKKQADLDKEQNCSISDIRPEGRSWVLPHPERVSPGMAAMVRDDEIERIAIQTVMDYEKKRGWRVESVEKDNKGFDLISRKLQPDNPHTVIDIRFIEVKGRADIGEIALTMNEYKTAERLGQDYWLYVVYHCSAIPEINIIRNPARMNWEPLMKIEHYHIGKDQILAAGDHS